MCVRRYGGGGGGWGWGRGQQQKSIVQRGANKNNTSNAECKQLLNKTTIFIKILKNHKKIQRYNGARACGLGHKKYFSMHETFVLTQTLSAFVEYTFISKISLQTYTI